MTGYKEKRLCTYVTTNTTAAAQRVKTKWGDSLRDRVGPRVRDRVWLGIAAKIQEVVMFNVRAYVRVCAERQTL